MGLFSPFLLGQSLHGEGDTSLDGTMALFLGWNTGEKEKMAAKLVIPQCWNRFQDFELN